VLQNSQTRFTCGTMLSSPCWAFQLRPNARSLCSASCRKRKSHGSWHRPPLARTLLWRDLGLLIHEQVVRLTAFSSEKATRAATDLMRIRKTSLIFQQHFSPHTLATKNISLEIAVPSSSSKVSSKHLLPCQILEVQPKSLLFFRTPTHHSLPQQIAVNPILLTATQLPYRMPGQPVRWSLRSQLRRLLPMQMPPGSPRS
jgi:hypothetical protein